MNGIENIIERISAQSAAECDEIAQNALEECERVRADYAKMEQDEYWKRLAAGAKEAEQRLEQLNNLADQESKKQVLLTQREMADAAFDLAARKLLELPAGEYSALLESLGIDGDCDAYALVARYKEELMPDVMVSLFNQ